MLKIGIESIVSVLLVTVLKNSESGHKKSQMCLDFKVGNIMGPLMLHIITQTKWGERGCMKMQICEGRRVRADSVSIY